MEDLKFAEKIGVSVASGFLLGSAYGLSRLGAAQRKNREYFSKPVSYPLRSMNSFIVFIRECFVFVANMSSRATTEMVADIMGATAVRLSAILVRCGICYLMLCS